MTGTIFDLSELSVHDGPGLRLTVFLKGCPLRCIWCHNPEGLSAEPQLMIGESACRHCGLCQMACNHSDCRIFGRCLHVCPEGLVRVSGGKITSDALAAKINQYSLLLPGFGGVTFSGGEPLMQVDFLHEVLDLLPGIPLAIETSGYASPEVFARVIKRMNFVYMDIKLADDQEHRRFTGVSNRTVLQNLEILRSSIIPCVIRIPLIPGITDTDKNLDAIHRIAGGLPCEMLPYNDLAEAKYHMLHMEFPYRKFLEGST